MPTENAQVIRRPVMSAYHSRVPFRFSISVVEHPRRERAGAAGPVVVRDVVVIVVKGRLRLFINNTEDLVDSREPCVNER